MKDRLRTMSEKEAVHMAVLLCDAALKCAKTVYHGGIYPENILYTENTICFITPGIKHNHSQDEVLFMAPEQFWGGEASQSTDIYSIGMLLYFACTGGRLPFDEYDANTAVHRRMEGEYVPAPEGTGRQLAHIVEKALSFKPEDRFGNLTEFRAVLMTCLDDEADRRVVALLGKQDGELSEIEKMMLGIVSGSMAGDRTVTAASEDTVESCEVPDAHDTTDALTENCTEVSGSSVTGPVVEEVPQVPASEADPAAEGSIQTDTTGAAAGSAPESIEEQADRQSETENAGTSAPTVEPAADNKSKAEKTVSSRPVDYEMTPEQKQRAAFYAREIDEGMKQRVREQYDRKLEREKAIRKKLKANNQRSIMLAALFVACLVSLAIIVNAGNGFSVFIKYNHSDIYSKATVTVTATPDVQVVGTVTVPAAEPTVYNPDVYYPAITEVGDDGAVQTTEPVSDYTPPTKSYEVVRSNVGWEEAERLARERGGRLAIIKNDQDLAAVCAKAEESGLANVWVGCRRVDSEYLWVDGSTSDLMFWDSGEPTVYDSSTKTYENYVLLWSKNGYWAYNDIGEDPASSYAWMYSGKLGYVIEFDN